MDSVLATLGMDPARYARAEFPAGRLVFAEGDRADRAYVVESGVIEIYKNTASGDPSTIALLKRGSIFGELALVSDKARSASAKAAVDAVCYAIEKKQFDDMMGALPPFPRFVMQHLIRSLHRITNIYAQNAG